MAGSIATVAAGWEFVPNWALLGFPELNSSLHSPAFGLHVPRAGWILSRMCWEDGMSAG